MNTYYLRVRASQYPRLLRLAEKLGVISIVDGEVFPTGGGNWTFLGIKLFGDPPAEGQPDTRLTVKAKNGEDLWHVNVRTPVELRAAAGRLIARGDADVADAFAKLPDFFSKVRKRRDELGRETAEDEAVLPDLPIQVYL